jgi:hypothetical protein
LFLIWQWKFVATTCRLKSVSSGRGTGTRGAGTATTGRGIPDLSSEHGHQFFDLAGFTLRAGQLLGVPLGQAEIFKMVTALFTLELINRHRQNLGWFILIFTVKD